MTDLFFIEEGDEHLRLDQILVQKFPTFSRTYFQDLIEKNLVSLNGEPIKKRTKPKIGDEVEVEFIFPPGIDLTPQNIPLEIIFEDKELIVVNKPAGMVVHPAVGNYEKTFVHALLWHCKDQLPGSDPLRPGIVHRLDKDTTGLLLAAKTTYAHQALVQAFSQRKIDKTYAAVTVGHPGEGLIRTLIGRDPKNRQKMAVVETHGKEAITRFKTLKVKEELALIEVDLLTGRTHQIRVHMHHHKTPILGDMIYGSKKSNEKFNASRQLLHAWKLELIHPKTGELLKFEAPLAADIKSII